jgi:hypothetical protein
MEIWLSGRERKCAGKKSGETSEMRDEVCEEVPFTSE